MKLRCAAPGALLVAIIAAGCGGPSQSATGSVHPAGWGTPPPLSQRLSASPQPVATMYDSISTSPVPARPFAVAGYTAGHWPDYLAMRRAFPHAHAVSIAISARYRADCLDVEPGDANPGQVVGWIRSDVGFARPCVYSSIWEYVHQIRPLLAAAHIPRSSIFEWDADYTGVAHLDASFDATQYTDKALGRNLDASIVTLKFLTIAQPPYKPQKPVVPTTTCFGKRRPVSTCYAAWSHALGASESALRAAEAKLKHNHCIKPYRRGVCVHSGRDVRVLAQRVRYFARKVAR